MPVAAGKARAHPLSYDPDTAVAHLRAADPVLAAVIELAGPFAIRPPATGPFLALARSIVFQQLSGKAAGTIFRRFVATALTGEPNAPVPEDAMPEPNEVLALDDAALHGAGLSRQKAAALRSLAEHFAEGRLSLDALQHWDDEEVIAHLTQVRGVGRWTAEMFLIFQLRRPNVLPVNDVGVNRAIMRQYGLGAMPTPAEVQTIGTPWRPYASVACWYLWRSVDARPPA